MISKVIECLENMFECLKHSNEYKTFENKLINKNHRIQNKWTEYSVRSSDRFMFCANIPTLCRIVLLMSCNTLFIMARLSFSSLSDLSIISNSLRLSVISSFVNCSWDSLIKVDVSLWSFQHISYLLLPLSCGFGRN